MQQVRNVSVAKDWTRVDMEVSFFSTVASFQAGGGIVSS